MCMSGNHAVRTPALTRSTLIISHRKRTFGDRNHPSTEINMGRRDKSGQRKAAPPPPKPKAETDSHHGTIAKPASKLLKPYPIALQQLILNVFKAALDTPFVLDRRRQGDGEGQVQPQDEAQAQVQAQAQPLSVLIQSVKQHLYNRDFDAAFTTADGELLRAYALRWSAGRALAYAGIFGAMWDLIEKDEEKSGSTKGQGAHVVCLGGGAGAEIVALAALWRDRLDGRNKDNRAGDGETMDVTAVDIADWSVVVRQLTKTVFSPDPIVSASAATSSSPSLAPPLLPPSSPGTQSTSPSAFNVAFKQLDILSQTDEAQAHLETILRPTQSRLVITLMFTLNELFSTSLPKTSSFLLRLTELVPSGTTLLVVDSSGSYSTVKLGKSGNAEPYPMHYLLDYVLLSVASGGGSHDKQQHGQEKDKKSDGKAWMKTVAEMSTWFRRDQKQLRYVVGDGVGLEDMRFQIHAYRRV